MNQRTVISFPEWCKKIASILAAGQKFKSETPVDMYTLLLGWRHGTLPEEKKKIVGVIDRHNGFTPECCKELKSHCHIPFADQQIVRIFFEVAKQHPEQLEMGVPSNDSINIAEDNVDVRAAYIAAGCVTDGLQSFQLKPPSKKGQDLLDHMHAFTLRDPKNQCCKQDGQSNDTTAVMVVVEPSAHLDLAISDSQHDIILKASNRDLTMRELIKDAGGQGATMKIVKCKLNALATIQSHSCTTNDETQLQVLKNKYELAASLAEIDQKDKEDQQAKKNQALMEKGAKAPDAVAKLAAKGGDVSKLSKLEIVAIFLISYNMHEKDNTHKKEYLLTCCKAAFRGNQEILKYQLRMG
jgi:hypothetical protein